MTQETCLLLKTKDKRCFFVNKRHLETLTEFSKTFKVEVFLVELQEKHKPLGLKNLSVAICDQTKNYEVKYNAIKRLIPSKKRSRKDILKDAEDIQNFVMKKLLSGEPLSLKELKEKYKTRNLTDACLCQHMSKVRNKLSRKGHTIQKVSAGTYHVV